MLDPQARYRKLYYWASLCNALSFNLMMGNLVTLFLLQINTSKSITGLISAFPWFALLCAGMGKSLATRYGVVRTITVIWIVRALILIPQILAPILVIVGVDHATVLVLLVSTQFIFQVFRGIGMVGNLPMVAKLANQKQRPGFIMNLQVLGNISGLFVILISSYFLQWEKIWIYSIFYAVGIALGVLTGILYSLQEEPYKGTSKNTRDKEEKLSKESLLQNILYFIADPRKRLFSIITILSFSLISTVSIFLIIFFKEAYKITDSHALLYSIGGPIGIISAGSLARPLLNRIGPKPICVFSLCLLLLGVSLLLLNYGASPVFFFWALGLYIVISVSFVSLQANLQAYYLNHFNDEKNLNSGLVFLILQGLGGFAAVISGIFLDILKRIPSLQQMGEFHIFQVFWLVFLLFTLACLILMLRLERGSAMTLSESIALFCSPREWQGIWLLESSIRQSTPQQHQELVKTLKRGGAHRVLAQEIPALLEAPGLLLRLEAIEALADKRIALSKEIQATLIRHVERSPYTTGANAASILGRRGVRDAIPVLRKAMLSQDYNLKAQSILAIGRLDDKDSLPKIQEILLTEHTNQRICIYTINTIKILGNPKDDIPLLLECFTHWQDTQRIEEEISLALSTLLGIESQFYPEYSAFLHEPAEIWRYELETIATSQSHNQNVETPSTSLQSWDSQLNILSQKYRTYRGDDPKWRSAVLAEIRPICKPALISPDSKASQHSQAKIAPNHYDIWQSTLGESYWQSRSGLFLLILLLANCRVSRGSDPKE